jgi:ATP-dependent DNA helicase DinG
MAGAPLDAVDASLARVTKALPGGGEDRPGQVAMAHAVTRAIVDGRHVVVQAGTGTGKSLAYLVPAALSGRPVVIATATKALQDQLVGKDLPFLADHLDDPLTYAVLKGRSNYVCRQRLGEIDASAQQLALDGLADRAPEEELKEIKTWAATTLTGDRAELPFEPSSEAWAAVSVGSRECPGASRCPQGGSCFAESARNLASDADVVVVKPPPLRPPPGERAGVVLPEHDVVIIDEAHQLEDVISSTFGVDLTAGRFAALSRMAGVVLDDPQTLGSVEAAGSLVADALAEHVGRRLRGRLPSEIEGAVADARIAVDGLMAALKGVPTDKEEIAAPATRAAKAAGRLAGELEAVLEVRTGHVMWVEGPDRSPSLRLAPVDVAPTLAERLWSETTAVLTSATVPPAIVPPAGPARGPGRRPRRGQPVRPRGPRPPLLRRPPPRPPRGGLRAGHPRRADGADRGRRRPHPRPVHVLPGDGRRRRGAQAPPVGAGADPARPAQAGARHRLRRRRAHLPVRHHGLLAGRRRARPHPVAGGHRPHPVPPSRRAADAGPAGGGPGRGVPPGRPRPGLHPAGPGRRPADPQLGGTGASSPSSTPRLAKARYRWDLVRALPPMRRTKDRGEAEAFLREVVGASGP